MGKVSIVYNGLLGGWYVVRGPHQTPIGGRHDSYEDAVAWLGQRSVGGKLTPGGNLHRFATIDARKG